MKRTMERIAVTFIVIVCFCSQAAAMPETLVPVGKTVGIHLQGELTVAEVEDSAEQAGLRVGDRIVSVNGVRAENAEALRLMIEGEETVDLGIEREGKTMKLEMRPEKTADGARLGIRVRDGITGVGTVTFYDPRTGRFGALGHGVSDPKSGRRIETGGGSILSCRVTDVSRGSTGAPGELHGAFSDEDHIGKIDKNSGAGIFGTMDAPCEASTALPAAGADEAKIGRAQILSNVAGTEVQSFDVEVLNIDPNDRNGRNYIIRVCDDDLLSATGGIVQGMSGSPILQDGRIIGAVTHVLVDDPTIGYGISIETMLGAAEAARTSDYLKTFFESRKFLLSNEHNYYRIGGK